MATPPDTSDEESESEVNENGKGKEVKEKARVEGLKEKLKNEDEGISFVDILRTIVFVVLVSGAVSYFVTRDSFTWGLQRPQWTRVEVVKTWFVRILCSLLSSLVSGVLELDLVSFWERDCC